MNKDKKRHILKTITWRILATLITIIIALIISHDLEIALNIGLLEVLFKMLFYYFHERAWFNKIKYSRKLRKLKRTKNLFPSQIGTSKTKRALSLYQEPFVLWFTGLSGSGKSAIAEELDSLLFKNGFKTFLLDGDILRSGINSDLGFDKNDREENIRRVAEIAKLFNDAGIITISSFISPYASSRLMAKNIIGSDSFIEIYVDTDIKKCEERDTKGLYQKARNGEIKNFTGINDPYEIPKDPSIIVKGDINGINNIRTQARDIYEKIKPFIRG